MYWAFHNWVALNAEYLYEKSDRAKEFTFGVAEKKTHRLSLGISFHHPSGFSGVAEATYYNQDGEFLLQLTDHPRELCIERRSVLADRPRNWVPPAETAWVRLRWGQKPVRRIVPLLRHESRKSVGPAEKNVLRTRHSIDSTDHSQALEGIKSGREMTNGKSGATIRPSRHTWITSPSFRKSTHSCSSASISTSISGRYCGLRCIT